MLRSSSPPSAQREVRAASGRAPGDDAGDAHTRRAGAGDTLLYDGDCELCRRAVKSLLRKPPPGLGATSFRDPGILQAFPAVAPARCEDAVQLVRADGSVLEGADALLEVVKHRWWAAPFVAAQRLPPLRRAMARLYALVARNRHLARGRHG